MQNIEPLVFLQPVITIAFSFSLVIYWHYKRRFSRAVLFYSLWAYAGAIAAKVVLQAFTAAAVVTILKNPAAIGFYFGIQTVIFEVGGAFLVAAFAVSRGRLKLNDAEGYGLGLALWENGALLGILPIVNLVVYYVVLASGTSASQALYTQLQSTQPQLFNPPAGFLSLVGFGVLERVSSLLVHFSWGYLALLSAFFHKRLYLLLALPMGFIDFLVPFARVLALSVFELLAFTFAVICLILTLCVARGLLKST